MRYRLRTLLMLSAIAPPLLMACSFEPGVGFWLAALLLALFMAH
jgi:hypothetical protein